jgi:hypothetical protein
VVGLDFVGARDRVVRGFHNKAMDETLEELEEHFENDTITDVPQAKVQSYLLCYSDQAIYRENQWNKFLGFKDCLTDFKAFRIGFSSTLTVRLKVKSFTNSGPSFLFVLFVLCFGTNCNVKTFT